ncbi:hypothetical protein [Elioraea rosea]|uniref:hypothetical protein n=1 Tax=Elioraea rosea TaxID=2492390 RepID=UPI001182E475|nr:hypothetical protein [Elioraea rosea]
MLLLGACAADSAADSQCIAARERFQQMWPGAARLTAPEYAGVQPSDAPAEMVSGVFGSALQFNWIPDRGARQRCYDSTMRSFGFRSYVPFEVIDSWLTPPGRRPRG